MELDLMSMSPVCGARRLRRIGYGGGALAPADRAQKVAAQQAVVGVTSMSGFLVGPGMGRPETRRQRRGGVALARDLQAMEALAITSGAPHDPFEGADTIVQWPLSLQSDLIALSLCTT